MTISIPAKIPLPFAYAAGSSYIESIPTASQIGITNGRASLHDGFPPLTFTPISLGGTPPLGADFNGILNEITAIQQWQEAGGFFPYDSAFATTIGGYPAGAVIQSANSAGFWINNVSANSTNPDTGGAGWTPLTFYGGVSVALSSADVTLTTLQASYPIITLTGTLAANLSIIFPSFVKSWIVVNNTTGSFNVNLKTASTVGSGITVAQGFSSYVYGDGTNINFASSASVLSFNSRTGIVTLTSLDVTNALTYTPADVLSVIGTGQVWQNFTSGGRSLNTTYTNSTGRPIQVTVTIYDLSGNTLELLVGGVRADYFTDHGGIIINVKVSGIIPIGATYSVNLSSGSTSIVNWSELR